MHRVNKKVVIAIFAILFAIVVFYFFVGEDVFFDVSNSTNILCLHGNNDDVENSLLNVDSKEVNSNEKIVVYITGAVINEGVYELNVNSRVVDIIELAGGVTDEADVGSINLAFVLEDGVKIYIPKKEENVNEIRDNTDLYVSKKSDDTNGGVIVSSNIELSGKSGGVNSSAKSSNIGKSDKININTASKSELESLPGIGPATAVKIMEYRKVNGKFSCIEDIKKVKGIGDSKFSKIKDFIKI